MKRTLISFAGAVILGTTLAACGGDGGAGSDYCTDLKSANEVFTDLQGGDAAGLETAFAEFHKLAAEAPSELEADWKVLDDGITEAEQALEDAGIQLSDFAKIQEGEIPENVDVAKLTEVATKFQALAGEEFASAAEAIQTHAKDECKVELS